VVFLFYQAQILRITSISKIWGSDSNGTKNVALSGMAILVRGRQVIPNKEQGVDHIL
jgi:hypothetical protein